ncbi:MAG: DUF2851 family protein [Muribaculaceae bacterium]
MEKLMQYVWQHKLYRWEDMTTNDGRRVRIVDPGLLNTDAGPDFFNAKVEIDGRMWAGNIEMHVRASDWARHGHDNNPAYDSVILHVVDKDDAPVYRTNGERIPQMVMQCSPDFNEKYAQLVNAKVELPCADAIKQMPKLLLTEWIERLAFERLQSKADHLKTLYNTFNGSWEDVCYVTLTRALGFGVNNDAFERLARCTPLRLLHKHSDSMLQIEAILFGQAGMLNPDENRSDGYYQQLCSEYSFLANKFSLKPIDSHSWKLARMRPQNFPFRRIAMLAQFIDGGFNLFADILAAKTETDLRKLFSVELNGYWATHFSFARATEAQTRALGERSIDIILINTVAPLLYARGELLNDSSLQDRAIALLETIKPENNSIVQQFTFAGIPCRDALTSQALIELRRNYCEARKCLYCKIGHRLLSAAAHPGNNR